MTQETPVVAQVGRNEPCPCGSGKKYKRCHGEESPGIINAPKQSAATGGDAANPFAGMDPSQVDPQWLLQFTQTLQRLPKGQLNRLQQLMNRAMKGEDVSKDAAQFESSLPVELQQLVMGANFGKGAPGAASESPADASAAPVQESKEASSKVSKIWNKLFKK